MHPNQPTIPSQSTSSGARRWILASGSPRRRELLAKLDVHFDVKVSHVDEVIDPLWTPAEAVEQLAVQKAEAVAATLGEREPSLLIASDTMVVVDGIILGKPANPLDAQRMLSALQGRSHDVFTSVVLLEHPEGRMLVRHSRTQVTLRALQGDEIERYVETGEPLDKAGAYAIQGVGSTLVTRIEGDYFTVVGLPMCLLGNMLQTLGYRLL